MNRRELFKTLSAAVVTLGAIAVSAEPKKYGRVTVDGHRAHLRTTGETLHVYVDGHEARGCYEADDVEGYALVFCTDPDHHRDWTKGGSRHHTRDRSGVCKMRVTGRVVIAPGGPFQQ